MVRDVQPIFQFHALTFQELSRGRTSVILV